jgi:hypothetical protein
VVVQAGEFQVVVAEVVVAVVMVAWVWVAAWVAWVAAGVEQVGGLGVMVGWGREEVGVAAVAGSRQKAVCLVELACLGALVR